MFDNVCSSVGNKLEDHCEKASNEKDSKNAKY